MQHQKRNCSVNKERLGSLLLSQACKERKEPWGRSGLGEKKKTQSSMENYSVCIYGWMPICLPVGVMCACLGGGTWTQGKGMGIIWAWDGHSGRANHKWKLQSRISLILFILVGHGTFSLPCLDVLLSKLRLPLTMPLASSTLIC